MSAAKSLSANSIERLIPDQLDAADATGAETLELHLARYRFASQFVTGKRVLDCACGVGYGSDLLAKSGAKHVMGADIDGAAVEYARQNYSTGSTEFRIADGTKLEDEQGFDTIVSLETVEHVPDPAALLANFVRLLKDGGTLIASVPVTPSVDVNPYHLHDFTPRSFRSLCSKLGLVEYGCLPQVQPFDPWKIARGQEARLDDMRKNLPLYYARHPDALAKRLWSTVRDGFANKYLTIAWEKPAGRQAE